MFEEFSVGRKNFSGAWTSLFREFKKTKDVLWFKKNAFSIVKKFLFKKTLGPDPDTATPWIRIRNTGPYTKLSYTGIPYKKAEFRNTPVTQVYSQ